MNLRLLAAAALLASALPAWAQPQLPGVPRTAPDAKAVAGPSAKLPPDTVLAESGKAKITRADYDLELTRLPPDLRGGFATTEKRVADLLVRMLVTKELAIEADETGVAREPYNAARLAYELERAKAQLRVAQIDKQSGDAFERDRAAFEKRALEIYRTQPQRFTTPETVQAFHILFLNTKGTPEERMALAKQVRDRLVAGESFAKLAAEFSDDPGTRGQGGRLPPFTKGEMDPEFEKAAFALKKGEISQPVVSQFGVHLIQVTQHAPARLTTWEEAAPGIMADLREKYVGEQRDAVLGELSEKARAGVNMDMVKVFVIDQPPEQDMLKYQQDAIKNSRAKRARQN